jgi:hypothetical protein
MNKLSKIAIISSLSVLGAVTTVNGVLFAQEDNTTPAQEIPVESRDRRAPMRDRENPSRQRQDNQRATPPMQNRGDEIKEKSPEQRAVNQDNKNSQPSILTSEQREQKIKERCELITSKISQHKEQFQIRSKNRLDKYNKLSARLEITSQKLSERGVEVSQYNSYIDELVNKINSVDASIQQYIQSSGDEAVSVCANQKPTESINTKREALKSIISQEREIRVYIKDTIIPYLRSIRPQEITSPDQTTNPSGTIPQVIPQ